MMKRITQIFEVAGILLFILVSCQRTPTSPMVSDTLVINMLLQAGNPVQTATVTKVMGNEDFGEIYVNDAFVYLNGVRLFNQPRHDRLINKQKFNYKSDYNYYTPSLFVQPGQECTLTVVTADSVVITGHTQVPENANFSIETGKSPFGKPITSQTSTIEFPILQWNASNNVSMYMLNIYKPGVDVVRVPVSLGHILFGHEFRLTSDIFDPKVLYIYELIQFDKNYYDYIVQGKNTAGIFGGRGVFGSMTAETCRYFPPKD